MAATRQNRRALFADQLERWTEDTFGVATRLLMIAVAAALVVLAVISLWDAVILVRDQIESHDLTAAVTHGVDSVFLTVILLELMNTVISRGRLLQRSQEFVVIGITSGIRHGLGLVATAGGSQQVTRVINHHTYHLTVPGTGNARDTVINLAINSASVLLLVIALWLIRRDGRRSTSTEAGESE